MYIKTNRLIVRGFKESGSQPLYKINTGGQVQVKFYGDCEYGGCSSNGGDNNA